MQQTEVVAVEQYVTRDVFRETNTAVIEKMKDLTTEYAGRAERHLDDTVTRVTGEVDMDECAI